MQVKHTLLPGSIHRDITNDKRPNNVHYDVVNFDSYVTERSLSFTASQGTKELYDAGGFVVGHCLIQSRSFLFVTNQTTDYIFEDVEGKLELIKSGTWNFRVTHPIKAIGIHESSTVNKIYFIDGLNQARSINVDGGSSIPDRLDFSVEAGNTGTITAVPTQSLGAVNGIVQYAYSMYSLGGSESQLSGFTPGVTISKKSTSASVKILVHATPFSFLRVYRLMFTSYGGAPEVALILERAVDSTGSTVEFVDDGNLFIATISIDEFNELGSDFIIPNAIGAKKQTLMLGNFETRPFRVNVLGGPGYYDPRAFSSTVSGSLGPEIDIGGSPGGTEFVSTVVAARARIAQVLNAEQKTLYVQPTGGRAYAYFREGGSGELEFRNNYDPVNKTMETIKLEWRDLATETIIVPWKLVTGGSTETFSYDKPYYAYMYDIVWKSGTGESSKANVMKVTVTSVISNDLEVPAAYTDFKTADGYALTVTDIPIANTGKLELQITGKPTFTAISGRSVAGQGMVYVFKRGLTTSEVAEYTGAQARVTATVNGTKKKLNTGLDLMSIDGTVTTQKTDSVDPQHDAINPNPQIYKTQEASTVIGASGTNIAVKLEYRGSPVDTRVFKKGETYRIGVVFRDSFGRETPAYWVVDQYIHYPTNKYKAHVALKLKVINLPPGAINARFVYVQRTSSDKTVLGQGVLQPVMINKSTNTSTVYGRSIYPHLKQILNSTHEANNTSTRSAFNFNLAYSKNDYIPRGTTTIAKSDKYYGILTPEVELKPFDQPITHTRAIGTCPISRGKTLFDVKDLGASVDESWSDSFDYIRSTIKGLSGDDDNNPDVLLDFWNKAIDERRLVAEYYAVGSHFEPNLSVVPSNDKKIAKSKFLDFDNVAILDDAISSTINYPRFVIQAPGQPNNLYAETTKCYVVQTDTAYDAGADFLKPLAHIGAIPIVDYINDNVGSQYGGQSYFVKSSNLYIIATASVTVGLYIEAQGDTFEGIFKIPLATDARHNTETWSTSIYTFIEVLLESDVNPKEFNTDITNLAGTASTLGPKRGVEVKQYWDYDKIFSQIPNQVVTSAKPANFIDITEYPSRIVPSRIKRTGEPVDSWTNILSSTYLDLEINHGPIAELIEFQDNLLAFQAKGIAIVDVYPKAQTKTSSGQVSLGKGSVLDDYRYLKVDTGTSGKFNVVKADKYLFYIDTWNNTIQEITDGDIGSLKGFNTMLNANIPNKVGYNLSTEMGFCAFRNEQAKEVVFKVGPGLPTLHYNYESKMFTVRRTYKGNFYIAKANSVDSTLGSVVHRHDEGAIGNYYGKADVPSLVEFRIEPAPGVDKVYDSIVIHKEGINNFTSIEVKSPYAKDKTITSGIVIPQFRHKFDTHTVHLPRIEGGRERWRTRQVWIKLSYVSTEPLSVDYIDIKFSTKK